jgi:hypothetical protein
VPVDHQERQLGHLDHGRGASGGVELAQLALEIDPRGHRNLLVTGIARSLRPSAAHCIR